MTDKYGPLRWEPRLGGGWTTNTEAEVTEGLRQLGRRASQELERIIAANPKLAAELDESAKAFARALMGFKGGTGEES